MFPPEDAIVLPPARFDPLPPTLIIPPPTGYDPPPCDEDDEDCEPPTEPPPEVPEPATIFILIAGASALWWGLRGLPVPARIKRKK